MPSTNILPISSSSVEGDKHLSSVLSSEIHRRYELLFDGNKNIPSERFLILLSEIVRRIGDNTLDMISLEMISLQQRRDIGRQVSALFGESHKKGKGGRGSIKLYDDYFTDDEWRIFFNWVNGKSLHS